MTSAASNLSQSAENPLVTIAIPTFNRASWLRECIDAALAQTYRNLEVLVSDNASTDQTPDVLSEIRDPRLRVIRQPKNIGPGRNCAACVTEARGEFVVIVPDDDRLAPWMLEKCVALTQTGPRIDVVLAIGDMYFPSERRTLPATLSKALPTGIHGSADILTEYVNDGLLSTHQCTVLMRRSTVQANGGYVLNCPAASDIATYLPLLAIGRAGFVNESCGAYCAHEATQTNAFGLGPRMKDFRTTVDVINHVIARSISDPEVRHKVELHAKGFIARHAIGLISAKRGAGASLKEVTPFLKEWKQDIKEGLPHIGLRNSSALLRSLAMLILPGTAIGMAQASLKRLRRLKQPRYQA
jgi:glycosyltransferase involved in cell wall biosynthesis